jgi:hypothetical protein
MTDDTRLVESGAESAPADTQTAAPAEAPRTLSEAGVSDAPAPAPEIKEAAPPPKANWPENWRDQLAGSDDKLKNLLNRYTSPDAFAKAFKELRTAYDSKKPAKDDVELPENPTEEQLAAYRKAKGVPERPEDYEFEVEEGRELNDGEYTIFMDFAKHMHERNIPASMVKEVSSWFLDYQEIADQKAAEMAYQARQQTEETLRAEWGPDYKANVNMMANVLQEHLGSRTQELLAKQFTDGSRLGDNEMFIRLMADLSRKVGGSSAELYTTDVATSGKSLEARKDELMKMMNDPDPIVRKKYWAPDTQAELQRITASLIRRQA